MNRGVVYLCSLFLFLFVLSPNVMGDGLLNGLENHIGFDEGTGITAADSTANAYDWTLSPASYNDTVWNTGIIGYGAYFDQSNSEFENTDNFLCNTETECKNLSFSVWIKPLQYEQMPILSWQTSQQGIKFFYESGYIQFGVKRAFTEYCAETVDNPILIGEWSNVIVSVTDEVVSIYVNGNEASLVSCSTSYSNPGDVAAGIGGAPHSSTSNFNGTIDEFAYWWNRSLTSNEADALYNGGDGLPYASYSLVNPEQIANFADINMSYTDTKDIFFNGFFTDYNSISVSFVDDIQGANAFLTSYISDNVTQTYITSHINMYLQPLGSMFSNDIRLRIQSNETDFETDLVISALNSLGSVQDTVPLTIGSGGFVSSFPTQIASINTPVTVPFNSTYEWRVSNYFLNFDGLTLQFNDPLNGGNVQLTTEKDQSQVSYNVSQFRFFLTPDGDDIVMRVETNSTETDILNNFNVFYQTSNTTYSTIINSLTIKIRKFGSSPTSPPLQLADIGQILMETNSVHTFRFKDFMSGYTGSAIVFDDEVAGATAYITDGTTYEQGNITVSVIGDVVRFDSGSNTFTQEMNIYGVNQAGDLTIPFEIVIGTPSYGGSTETISSFRKIIGWVVSLFPDASDLSFPARIGFVLITMLITCLLVIGMTSSANPDLTGPIVKYVLPFILGGETLFFISIKYIPISFVVILLIIAGGILYMVVNRNGS